MLGKTLADIENMSYLEFRRWIAYDKIEPLPDPWRMAGTIAAAVVNPWAKTQVSPEDFIPRVKEPPKRLTPAEQTALFKRLADGAARKDRTERS